MSPFHRQNRKQPVPLQDTVVNPPRHTKHVQSRTSCTAYVLRLLGLNNIGSFRCQPRSTTRQLVGFLLEPVFLTLQCSSPS